MSDWDGIRKRITELQSDLRRPDLDPKALPHLLDSTLSLLSRVITSTSLQYEEERHKRLMAWSERQLEQSEGSLLGDIRRALKQEREAINEKLDEILKRLAEPPRDFEE